MGHQIACYLSIEDSILLSESVLQPNDDVILKDRSRGPYPEVVASPDLVEHGNRNYLFYFAQIATLDSSVMTEVPTQGYWAFETLFSPVVELTLGRFDGAVLRRSRLYYTDSFYDDKRTLVTKPEAFLVWAKQIFTKSRRLLTYDSGLKSYLGPHAAQMRDSGIELRQF